MVLPRRTRSDGSALLRRSSSTPSKGRNLLRSLKFRTSSCSKRNVSFGEKHHHYVDGNDHPFKEEEEQLLLTKRHPWNEELQVTHFRKVTEVKQQKSLFDEDSDFTGPLLPPSPKISLPPKKKVEGKVAACESSSTTSTAASTACSSSSSSSLFDVETNTEEACETIVVGLEEEHHRQEAELMQEMFHDLTCRCFTPASCG